MTCRGSKQTLVAAAIAAGLTIVAPIAAAAGDTHTVRPGDTLSGIAAGYDGLSWPDLWDANRDVIGSNPDLIFPGQRLAIDVNPKVSSSSSASRQQTASRGAEQRGTVRPATGSITSPYGMRTHPITGVYKLHTGTDFGAGDGQAYVARAGTVASVEWNTAYGNLVTINHGGNVQTRYAHLASVTVSAGHKVDAGDVVGRIGSTGYATGPHLHFEVLTGGEFVNPMNWLGG